MGIACVCAVALTACTDQPAPLPTVFDRPSDSADTVPGPGGDSYADSRLVATWMGERVYLAIPQGGELVCIVAVGDGQSGSACSAAPPLELNGTTDYRYDLDVPASRDGWERIGIDVYARP